MLELNGILVSLGTFRASQLALVVKNLPANTGNVRDMGSIPGLGRSPGGSYGNPLQYSCLEKPHEQRRIYTKVLSDPDNHNGVVAHLDSDILQCEVNWALDSLL